MTYLEFIFGGATVLLILVLGAWVVDLRKKTRLSHRDPAIRRSNFYGFNNGRPDEKLRGVPGEKPEKPLGVDDSGSPGMFG